MPFQSQYADRIWNEPFEVSIPDVLTMNRDYIRKFGVHVTGKKDIDSKITKNFTNVMIPIIKIAEYFDDGIEVRIHGRENLVKIFNLLNGYLDEWANYAKYSINASIDSNRELLAVLDKLTKIIYNKLDSTEYYVSIKPSITFGLTSPLGKKEEISKKPNYIDLEILKNKPDIPTSTTPGFSSTTNRY